MIEMHRDCSGYRELPLRSLAQTGMDTVTHALSGALVGRLLATRQSALTPLQAVVVGTCAATFPDSDVVLQYVSELAYLRGHRGITHSLILMPLWAVLIAWLTAKAFTRTRHTPGAWRYFYWPALAGIFVHILGDLITQFGTMIWAPFSDTRYGLATTFIIDLMLTGFIVAGLIASAIWREHRTPAVIAACAVLAWVMLSALGRYEALQAGERYARAQGLNSAMIDAAPRPASPFNWTVIVKNGEQYHWAHLNTRRNAVLPVDASSHFIRRLSAPYVPVAQAQWQVSTQFGTDAATQALAREVWAHPHFAFYRWFARFPVLQGIEIRSHTQGTERCAWFKDMRFAFPGRDVVPFRYGLCQATASAPWRLYAWEDAGRRALTADTVVTLADSVSQ